MTQNGHVYAICGRLEVAVDVISGRNEKTIEGYMLVNVEIATSSNFREKIYKIVTVKSAVMAWR